MNQPGTCAHCGAKLAPGSRFCEVCGKPVVTVAAASPPAPPESAPGSKTGLYVILAIVGAVVVVGCIAVAVFGFMFSQNKNALPGLSPSSIPQVFAIPTQIAPTNMPPTQPLLPTLPPESPALPTTTATATLVPRPTTVILPGLYVTNLRFEPSPPKRGQEIGFYATFLNTTPGEQNPRWLVYIYRVDNLRNSFGETSTAPMTMPVGQKELRSLGSWKLGGGGDCEDFVARVAAKDNNNQVTFFNKTDGQLFELRFSVCP